MARKVLEQEWKMLETAAAVESFLLCHVHLEGRLYFG